LQEHLIGIGVSVFDYELRIRGFDFRHFDSL
jgi:hypothetical protein